MNNTADDFANPDATLILLWPAVALTSTMLTNHTLGNINTYGRAPNMAPHLWIPAPDPPTCAQMAVGARAMVLDAHVKITLHCGPTVRGNMFVHELTNFNDTKTASEIRTLALTDYNHSKKFALMPGVKEYTLHFPKSRELTAERFSDFRTTKFQFEDNTVFPGYVVVFGTVVWCATSDSAPTVDVKLIKRVQYELGATENHLASKERQVHKVPVNTKGVLFS